MKVSLIVLTFNRAETVKRAMDHNLQNSGYPIHEIIHVDNGSSDNVREVMETFKPTVKIYHHENLGVAKGYNRGYLLATGDYLCITGCDRLMPENWLKKTMTVFETLKDAGIISIYHRKITETPERILGPVFHHFGLRLQAAIPIEARTLSRKLLLDIGFLREDFGLYSHEDCEWWQRAVRVCNGLGLKTFCLSEVSEHLGTPGASDYDGKDDRAYHEMKKAETQDPRKDELLAKVTALKFPYWNGYSRIEKYK